MDATQLLSADHDRVRGLFARWQAATDGDDFELAAALEQLGNELEANNKLGAPTSADNADRSLSDLREQASQEQVPGRSKIDREELGATVMPPTGARAR